MLRNIIIAVILMGFVFYFTSRSNDTTPSKAEPKPKSPLTKAYEQHLKMAVLTAANAVECGYSQVGYGFTEPKDAAKKLVQTMNTAIAPLPGDPKVPGPNIVYVLGKVSEPWQVAVFLDEKTHLLKIEGYGANVTTPVSTQAVSCLAASPPHKP